LKITREDKEFNPVIIKIETEEELKSIKALSLVRGPDMVHENNDWCKKAAEGARELYAAFRDAGIDIFNWDQD